MVDEKRFFIFSIIMIYDVVTVQMNAYLKPFSMK